MDSDDELWNGMSQDLGVFTGMPGFCDNAKIHQSPSAEDPPSLSAQSSGSSGFSVWVDITQDDELESPTGPRASPSETRPLFGEPQRDQSLDEVTLLSASTSSILISPNSKKRQSPDHDEISFAKPSKLRRSPVLSSHRTRSLPEPRESLQHSPVTPQRTTPQIQPFASTSKLQIDNLTRPQQQIEPISPRARRLRIDHINADRAISAPVSPIEPPSKAPIRPIASSSTFSDEILDEGVFESLFSTVFLEKHIIVHDSDLQMELERRKVPWGITYELYRGVQRGKWTVPMVLDKVSRLQGLTDKDTYRITNLILGTPLSSNANPAIGEELHREQEAIFENKGRGLGLMGTWGNVPNWYGGRIQQFVRLLERSKKDGGGFLLVLEAMEMRKSTRLARKLGSRRVIQVRGADNFLRDKGQQVIAFLSQAFIIAGRVFLAIPPKDTTVYLVEIQADHERFTQPWCGDEHRLTFGQILEWHNPVSLNSNQPFAKWFARFHLMMSTSVPVLEFEPENIKYIPDIVTDDWKGPGKAPAEKIATDGSGFINIAAMKKLSSQLDYEFLPTAVQGRQGGSKGLWSLLPSKKDSDSEDSDSDDSDELCIYISDSQLKIQHSEADLKTDRSLRIFDLLDASHANSVTAVHHLSGQSILNLSVNGVRTETLMSLMKAGLEQSVEALLDWTGDYPWPRLWHGIDTTAGVTLSRAARLSAGQSRVLGFSRRSWKEDSREEIIEGDESPAQMGRGESGAPISLGETTIEVLQAGFRPSEFQYLNKSLISLANHTWDKVISKFKIPLPKGQSIEAFVIPDPLGILDWYEIYYRSTDAMKDMETQRPFNTVVGDVLMGRYPIRVASDIQRVHAVDKPELYNWPDVVIVSTQGGPWGKGEDLRTLMSVLGGGDVDGDTVFLIWEANLVKEFKARHFVSEPENLLEDNFERNVTTVAQFVSSIKGMPRRQAQRAFFQQMFKGYVDGRVGLYSLFHESALYDTGYKSEKAVRLAYIGNHLLDAPRTGVVLKPDVFKADQREFGNRRPKWMGGDYETMSAPPFVLDEIRRQGKKLKDELLAKLEQKLHDPSREILDQHLLAPYKEAKARTQHPSLPEEMQKMMKAELARIKERVQTALAAFQEASKSASAIGEEDIQSNKRKTAAAFTETIHDYRNPFEPPILSLSEREVDLIKASYAYSLQPSGNFVFHVAYSEALLIKAMATGIAPCSREFDLGRSFAPRYRKLFSKQDADD
ncbi:RNA dependent RNA polymerase-domain-containing protein [Mycena floridula]|nr:RNA dependent RNA polymerase-domain-containing protein [Mycena floridula]